MTTVAVVLLYLALAAVIVALAILLTALTRANRPPRDDDLLDQQQADWRATQDALARTHHRALGRENR